MHRGPSSKQINQYTSQDKQVNTNRSRRAHTASVSQIKASQRFGLFVVSHLKVTFPKHPETDSGPLLTQVCYDYYSNIFIVLCLCVLRSAILLLHIIFYNIFSIIITG